MKRDPLAFLAGCLRVITTLPQSERLDRALWLLDQMKTGPMGRRILADLQREYMTGYMLSLLIREDNDA